MSEGSYRNKILFLDVTGSFQFVGSSRFYVDDKRDDFDPSETPCLSSLGCLKPLGAMEVLKGLELLLKGGEFRNGTHDLRFGGFFDSASLKGINKNQAGLIGNQPFPIQRYRVGILGEISNFPKISNLPIEDLFVQLGGGIVWYRADVTTDPVHGLDIGAKSNLLSDGSEINEGLGFGFRETFGWRFTPFGNGWPGFFFALDLSQNIWRNNAVSLNNFHFGVGARAGLSLYLWGENKSSPTSSQ